MILWDIAFYNLDGGWTETKVRAAGFVFDKNVVVFVNEQSRGVALFNINSVIYVQMAPETVH